MDDGRTSNERYTRSPEFSADRPSRVVTSKTRSWTVRTGRDSSTSGGGLVRYARDINRPAGNYKIATCTPVGYLGQGDGPVPASTRGDGP